MENKTFIIRDESVISRLVTFIRAQKNDELLEVTVKEHHKDRTIAQNSTMWMWITDIANEWGWTKEDVHKNLKKRALVPIYERDDEGYAEMVQAVRKVHKCGMVTEAKAMEREIIKRTSTRDADVKQFAEYLTEIERDAISKGIPLRHPADYHFALMLDKSAA